MTIDEYPAASSVDNRWGAAGRVGAVGSYGTLDPADSAVDAARFRVPVQQRRTIPMQSRSPVDLEVIIPAYNEATRIEATLRATVEFLSAAPYSSRIIVVDNGSVDGTGAVCRRFRDEQRTGYPIEVLGCSRPGKGAAVRRGLLSSRAHFVGFFDADLSTPLETLTVAMETLREGAMAVVASRHAAGSTFVRPRRAGRRLGALAFRVLARDMVAGVSDTQCGFKFFDRATVVRALAQCRTSGFAFDVELLRRLQSDGHRIIELPVAWTDSDESTFRPVRDGIASFTSVLHMNRSLM